MPKSEERWRMTEPELIQCTFSLPGGKGKYLDILVEFLTWLEPRQTTTRMDAHAWFQERYNALKSAQYYLPVLRDLGVIELDRGSGGAVRPTDLGRTVLNADDTTRARVLADYFVTRFVANRDILGVYAASAGPVSLNEIRDQLGSIFPFWTTHNQFHFRLGWMESLGILHCVGGRTYQITDLGRGLAEKYPPVMSPPSFGVGLAPPVRDAGKLNVPSVSSPLDSLIQELHAASTDSGRPNRFETALREPSRRLGSPSSSLAIGRHRRACRGTRRERNLPGRRRREVEGLRESRPAGGSQPQRSPGH